MTTHYEMLEVSHRASVTVIRAAYRCLAQHDHPDKKAGCEAARQRMADINRAYAVLSDREKRQTYDAALGLDQALQKRRGAGSGSDVIGQRHGNGHTAARAYAFRPLV